MADYHSIAKKLAASEERLFKLLDDLDQVRRDYKAGNYKDQEIATRGEQLFDDARKEQQALQTLQDQITTLHKSHWQREYQREMDAAREALLPLARAWMIAHKALGDRRVCMLWMAAQLNGQLLADLERRVSGETHAIPVEAPRASFALERAEDEVTLGHLPSPEVQRIQGLARQARPGG